MSYFTRQRTRLRPVATLAAAGIILVACGGSDDAEPPATPPQAAPSTESALLTPAEFDAFRTNNPDAPVINVHIPYEGHIDGTDSFIPFDTIVDSADLPDDRDAPIALYCRSGNMSAQAAADLAEAGYTNVVDLDGGMNAWEAAGNELVDDPTAAES